MLPLLWRILHENNYFLRILQVFIDICNRGKGVVKYFYYLQQNRLILFWRDMYAQ